MGRVKIVVGAVVIAAAAAGVTWMLTRPGPAKPGRNDSPSTAPASTPEPNVPAISVAARPGATAPATASAPAAASGPAIMATSAPATAPATRPAMRPMVPALTDAQALAEYDSGMKLLSQSEPDMLAARASLSKAVLSGRLPADKDEKARTELTRLAQATLFSRGAMEGDPYTGYYKVQPGDVLERLELRLGLRVPSGILVKVNGLASANALQAGSRIKVINGPFHAIVWKKRLIMDLFLQRDDLPPVWVKRLRVGLGKNGSTPVGMWMAGHHMEDGVVKPGAKKINPSWTAPPRHPRSGEVIPPDDPDYALADRSKGQNAYWIHLVGTETATEQLTDYAIHSTRWQDSIGKEESSGCIRLADEDIELVWSLLYEGRSTVETRK